MDYYDGHGFDDSYNKFSREEQQFPSEYGVDTIDEYNHHNNGIVDRTGNRMKHSSDHRDSSGKLFVGGVAWETTEDTFADYFSQYGDLVDSVIMTDRNTGRPRGFGFVTFADPAVADKVLEEDHVIDGRTVELKRTVPREEMDVKSISKTKKIFVGGLPSSLGEDELKEYFSFYGDIVEHQIMLDHKTGRSRGFGFVTFHTEESVDRIFTEGKIHELGGKQVEIKKAEPKRPSRDFNGNFAKPYRSQGPAGNRFGHEDRYNGEVSGDYGGFNGYGGYAGYGANYMASAPAFYGAYGGYGYGYMYGPSMYGVGYGMGGYANMGGYSGAVGHGGAPKGSGPHSSVASRFHPYQK